MKVGGIGIQFIDKKGRDIAGESFLYVNVVGWKYSRGEQKLHIEVGKTGGPIDKEVTIITSEGEEIGLLMRDHAKSVAKQLKQEKAEAKEAETKMLAEAVGKYRIENPVTCRAGPELDTEQSDGIEVGTIVDVTEAAMNNAGTIRLKCDAGWFSLKSHLAVKLDDEGKPLSHSFCRSAMACDARALPHAGNPIEDGTAKKKIDTTGISADSVAVPAGTEAEDLAKELGMLGDATFEVKQKYIKKTPQGNKCPEQVQLKVGGMGLNVFAGQMPVANYLYFAIKGWTYSQREETFEVALKSGEKLRFSTKQGAEIAENMNEHASSLQEAKQEAAAAAEAEAEAEEGVPPEDGDYDVSITDDSEGDVLLGYWRVQNPILVRAGVEVSTDEAGKLEQGDVVQVTEVSKNSTGTVRLKCKLGWVSFKPHLVRKLVSDYKPDSSELENITACLERVLSMYSVLDDNLQLEVEGDLVSKWVAVFGGGDAGAASPAADQRLVNAQKAAEESAERAEALEKESAAKSEEIAALKEAASAAASAEGGQAAELSTKLEAANSTIEELKKELAAAAEKAEAAEAAASKDDSAEELATLRAAAEKAEDERATSMGKIEKLEAQQKKLQGENAKLKEQLAEAKKAGPPAATNAADDEPALPAEVQALFDKANSADASKDKKTALTLYQTGVKKAMAHMKAHPETKKTLTPILQQVMKRAQELKAEIAAAKAAPAAGPGAADSADGDDPEDPLPPDIRAEVNKAKAADTPGNEAAAIALFEASAKRAMVYLRANPAKKAELTPTLQALIMRTRALKEELKSAE
eukprot:COSAG02_NODE_336_length_24344_cov_63.239101_2_plen_808_part_00